MKLGSFYLQMHALVRELIPDIRNDYRAQDSEPGDETPAMTLTIGADAEGWSYQTGDNSFTGSAYGYRDWSVVTLYRDSDAHEVAEEIISQLIESDGGNDGTEPQIFPPWKKPRQYVTTYCNKPHWLKSGKPCGHECYTLPSRGIRLERVGKTDQALEVFTKWSRNR